MLMPNEKGNYDCGNSRCKFESNDIFDYLRHMDIEYKWGIRLGNEGLFNLFSFIETLNHNINIGNLEEAYELIQSFSLMMVNASEGEFNEFLQESFLLEGTDDVVRGLENMLRKEKND